VFHPADPLLDGRQPRQRIGPHRVEPHQFTYCWVVAIASRASRVAIASRRRRWRQTQYTRLFFAIGVILLAYNWLTLMIWFVFAQVWTFRLLQRWLGPLMQL
jgi:hypothetical protein